MGDALDSSYSESEGLPDQEKPLSEFGRRWNHNGANSTTDMDSDYRREMSGMHHEARARDGGGGGGASTLQRRHRVRGVRPGDSSADASPVAGGNRSASSSAREEERRKVVEIENK